MLNHFLPRGLLGRLRAFAGDRSGAHITIAAFFLVPILAASGVAIDSIRGYTVRTALAAAVDTATLAAAHERESADRQATFDRYFAASFPDGHYGAEIVSTSLTYDSIERRLHGSAVVELDTTLMAVVGQNSLTISSDAVIQAELRGMELVLVMDNTGSMRGGDSIGRMKNAARGLINALFDGSFDTQNRYDDTLSQQDRLELENLFVALVPYSATVNIGRGAGDQAWTHDGVDWEDGSWTGGTERFAWLDSVPAIDDAQTENTPGSSPDAFYQNSIRVDYASRTPLCVCDDDDETACEPGNAADRSGCKVENGQIVWQEVGGDPRGWLGCVMARAGDLDRTDTPPDQDDHLFTPFLWHSNAAEELPEDPQNRNNDWDNDYYNSWPADFSEHDTEADTQNSSRGPNLGCPPPITPLTRNYTEIMDAIDEMDAWHRGGTWSNVGMAWGWRALSPRWRSHWGLAETYETNQVPLDYGYPGMEKVVVVLTDGTNQWYQDDFTSFGYRTEGRPESQGGLGATSNGTATSEANSRMATICERMRRGYQGDVYPQVAEDSPDRITIYTIVLKATSQESTFENCASADENYFFASDNSELDGIFQRISEQLSDIRIAE
ncbi:MAG: hypothetical protein GVY13_11390 [Alphaproteobacteria bacterium]|jgi:Flp pilus assembly protein TadG|nr:hypothetical protein [Alphaproteobacteria bacterium]